MLQDVTRHKIPPKMDPMTQDLFFGRVFASESFFASRSSTRSETHAGLKFEKNGQMGKTLFFSLSIGQRDEIVRLQVCPTTTVPQLPLFRNSQELQVPSFFPRGSNTVFDKNRNLCSFPGMLFRLVRLDHLSASHIQRRRRVVSSCSPSVSLTTKNLTFAPD